MNLVDVEMTLRKVKDLISASRSPAYTALDLINILWISLLELSESIKKATEQQDIVLKIESYLECKFGSWMARQGS